MTIDKLDLDDINNSLLDDDINYRPLMTTYSYLIAYSAAYMLVKSTYDYIISSLID
jgi:hypothetical protein